MATIPDVAPTGTLTFYAFRATVAEVAARAKERLPEAVNGRIEKAVKLVLGYDVTPQADGTIVVGSSTDPLKEYRLVGATCNCQDFAHGKAPDGWCAHRIAAGIAKRVGELLPQGAALGSVESTGQPASPAGPLPEARCSVNVRVQIAGRDTQITLRGDDEAEVLTRLETLLARYPLAPPQAPSPPQGQGQDAAPQCPTHGALKRSTKSKGWYCPTKLDDDTWCPSKGR